MSHCIQYAFVGVLMVTHTENMSDQEIRKLLHVWHHDEPIERFDRCPECEEWTRDNGVLRKEVNCPAVQQALARQEVERERS